MKPKSLWIDNILVGVEPLSNPIHEFSKYQWSNLFKYYSNFLDFIGDSLYEDTDFAIFINSYAHKLNFYQLTIEKLRGLNVVLDPFYMECSELSDFEVIRRPEWDVMMPIAKECVRLLEQEHAKGDGDMVLSAEDCIS